MIKKIFRSQFDLANLSLEKAAPTLSQGPDYHGVVVRKPWGYEYLFFENKYVAIWVLYLKNGARTSMHCHPSKKTSLLNLYGKVATSTLTDMFVLEEKNALILANGTFHSTASIFEGGSFIMEIETPPNKLDLVRLKDAYGRENKGYEGATEMTVDTTDFEYHVFNDMTNKLNFKQRIFSIIPADSLADQPLKNDDLICPIEHTDANFPWLGEVLYFENFKTNKDLLDNSVKFLTII